MLLRGIQLRLRFCEPVGQVFAFLRQDMQRIGGWSGMAASVAAHLWLMQADVNSVAKAPEILEKVVDNYYGYRYIVPSDITKDDIAEDVRKET